MIVLSGADLVLPDRVVAAGGIVLEHDRIAAVETRPVPPPSGARHLEVPGCTIVPGFIDLHVHGIDGHDTLAGDDAVAEIARRLPRYGVTAFCPTSVACKPAALASMLRDVERARHLAPGTAARVLGAHLESNFINPDYRGAQPLNCLRVFRPSLPSADAHDFSGDDILAAIEASRSTVAIVTLAPEMPGGLDLVRALSRAGHIVSIGHTGATYEQAREAIAAGVRHATHLFNRMTPMAHRAPGTVGAVLESSEVCAEIIGDGHHVHPAVMRLAIRAKGIDRVVAVTDGTAGSGLPVGARARLGDRAIVVTERVAVLEDGTMAGSVATMDAVFRVLVRDVGLSAVEAAALCASTPARQLGRTDLGRLEPGALADLVVLDANLRVVHTIIGGQLWGNPAAGSFV
jgi:N-acetylglucosamine-6-phosphate deacetylase